jgi:hypothetical protein
MKELEIIVADLKKRPGNKETKIKAFVNMISTYTISAIDKQNWK